MAKTQKAKKSVAKKAEAKEVKAPKLEYFLEISVNDVEFKTKAESLEQALTKFTQSPDFPHGAKTKVFVVYGKGKVVRRRLWQTPEARRILTTIAIKPIAISILAEQLTRSLNE